MAARNPTDQIALPFRHLDSAYGVTRATVKRLAEHLGVDEVQAIHLALRQMADKLVHRYEADDGPLGVSQMRRVRRRAAQSRKQSIRSSLLEDGAA